MRGQNVAAGAVLVKIDNPETVAKRAQSIAAKVVAEARLAQHPRRHTRGGHRRAQGRGREGGIERGAGAKDLRPRRQLAEHDNAPQARLDQATDSLNESQRALDQAKSAYEQAVNGYTREERQIAEANVVKAVADIEAVQSIVDQMTVYAPVASQVYQRNVEPGE